MRTELWFRNPLLYVRELVEAGHLNMVVDRGTLYRKGVDPARWADLHVPADRDYRLLVCGDQGVAELRRGHTMENPAAVYPAWDYRDGSIAELEHLAAGRLRPARSSLDLPPDERPVPGQQHRVVVIFPPRMTEPQAVAFYDTLRELQADYPECIVHLHGRDSYRLLFGLGFRSVDIDARVRAAHGEIMMPNGRHIDAALAGEWRQWITLLGFTTAQLKIPRNRCLYNIASARWAADHWNENLRFRASAKRATPERPPEATKDLLSSRVEAASPGDELACDYCSLQRKCKFFRAESVCSVPESEASSLAKMFGTRDVDQIISALGGVVSKTAERYERAVTEEDRRFAISGELNDKGDIVDPEITKLGNSVVQQAEKLVKLLDPQRFKPTTKVQIASGEGTDGVTAAAVAASIAKELEAKGLKPGDLPRDVLERVMKQSEQRALVEAEVVE